MPSSAPRWMTTIRRFSVGADASASETRPSETAAVRPSRAERRVNAIISAPLEFGGGQQQGQGVTARTGAADRLQRVIAQQWAEIGLGQIGHVARTDPA